MFTWNKDDSIVKFSRDECEWIGTSMTDRKRGKNYCFRELYEHILMTDDKKMKRGWENTTWVRSIHELGSWGNLDKTVTGGPTFFVTGDKLREDWSEESL